MGQVDLWGCLGLQPPAAGGDVADAYVAGLTDAMYAVLEVVDHATARRWVAALAAEWRAWAAEDAAAERWDPWRRARTAAVIEALAGHLADQVEAWWAEEEQPKCVLPMKPKRK